MARPPLPAALFALLLCSPIASATTPDETSAAAALGLSACSLQALSLPDGLPANFAVEVEFDGAPCALVLHRRTLRASDFRAIVQLPNGRYADVAPPEPRTYSGELHGGGVPEAGAGAVRASLSARGLSATASLADGTVYCIQPLADAFPGADAAVHVVYRAGDAIDLGTRCGVPPGASHAPLPSGAPKVFVGNAVAEIALAADVEFYAANGSSVTNTIADMEAVMNGVESIYEGDVGITYAITAVVVHTAEADPYTTSSPGGLLNEFQAEWNANQDALQRDVAHLFTGKNLDGSVIGIAQLGVICSSSAAYGLSQSRYTSNLTNRIGLTAHELGHNWSAQHCDGAAGGCFIMCSGLGGCSGSVTQFEPMGVTSITNFKNAKTCLGDAAGPLVAPFADSFAVPALDDALWTGIVGATVSTSGAAEPSTPYSLNLDSSGAAANQQDRLESNTIALGAAGTTLVSFASEHVGVENGKALVCEYFSNALAWVELVRITSDGINQSAFAPTSAELPANALHNGFRVRFRVEGSASNDDWFVDDVRVGPAPPPPPQLFSVSPGSIAALPSSALTLTGVGLTGGSVMVNGAPLIPFLQYNVIDDHTVQFTPSVPAALGSATVAIETTQGTSNALPFTYVSTAPPKMVAPSLVFNGTAFELTFASLPGDIAFLLVNLDGATLPFQGGTLLQFDLFVPLGALGATGVGSLATPFNGAPAGTQLYTQLLVVDPPGTNPATARTSNIGATLVLF